MTLSRLLLFSLPVVLVACATVERQGTITELRNRQVDITDEHLEGGLEKAMISYQRFLVETPDSSLAPEAIRRLADLKIEKEYGLLTPAQEPQKEIHPASVIPAHETGLVNDIAPIRMPDVADVPGESDDDFEQRAAGTEGLDMPRDTNVDQGKSPDDLERTGPLEALALYSKLLEEYPLYDRNDQVLYQMSRAYEELGRVEDAMEVMNQLVEEYPQSRYIDEVQFRRAEFYFTRRQYLDAEEAYQAIVEIGEGSSFYPFALYKLGWTFYKQELYEDAIDNFIALLDYKVTVGYDFEQTEDESELKRIEDTFRVTSLSFSSLGGADVVVEYFARNGSRSYDDLVYSNLGEYYFDKRRYSDANETYTAFVERNPFHAKAPKFQMRIIEINIAGGFPSLVLESKKVFATSYGLESDYWLHFDPQDRPEILADLKTNLTDLANHYHAQYQDPELKEEKSVHFEEALRWYRELLASFPSDTDSPAINYQLADLLLENRSFGLAAQEYEKTAYEYPTHEKSATAGYAAVFAFREHLKAVAPDSEVTVKREVVRTSVRFAETFPEHEKAPVVLGAAVDDLYDMQAFDQAVVRAHQLIDSFPEADGEVLRSAWIVVGHASYELERYAEAETAYSAVLETMSTTDTRHDGLVDNLAASIYKQGEAANADHDFRLAADHFLRVSRMAPTSAIRPNAEFDAASALIQLQDWSDAAVVLSGFRQNFPGHELQPEVTKKIAYVYREDGRLVQAAQEYERIETEAEDVDIRREALLSAAELYEEAGDSTLTLQVYQRYVNYFPEPLELNVETRNKISLLLKAANDQEGYLAQLEKIVSVDARAGEMRTARTRYLASLAALVLAERTYDRFTAVRLIKPFETNLHKKQALMKEATGQFNQLLEYEVADVTAASTYHLAEIYAHFSKALMESERPDNLSPLELEQYELAIEEQAYPFEEKAIAVHESNLELISMGVYNTWVDKSLQKLAKVMPARYDRPELDSPVMMSLESYTYGIERLADPAAENASENQPPAMADGGVVPPPSVDNQDTTGSDSGNAQARDVQAATDNGEPSQSQGTKQ